MVTLTMRITSSRMLPVSPDPGFRGVETQHRSETAVDPVKTDAAGEFYAWRNGDLYVGSVKGNLECVVGPALSIDSNANEALPHGIPRIVQRLSIR